MRERIKSLTPSTEFAIVITIAFGWFIVKSIDVAVRNSPKVQHSVIGLFLLVIYELVLLAVLLPFLHTRGWTLKKIGLHPTLKDTGIGILLALAAYAVWICVWFATVYISRDLAWQIVGESRKVMPSGVPIALSVLLSIVNPVFEEIFVTGYVITAVRSERPVWVAINISVAIRLLYHLYQGPLGVLSIVPTGLIFAAWYVRSGKLWPLIVAHAAINFVGMLPHSKF